ncbi:PepSY domain-containing protein [Dolosigranulum savutiense]|uniref:PepSY domain-containing protein n=1 Tax=Dolosigranulum savutiense TaxID=3110288 RepID=A0AB74TQC0_9LACT
MFDELSKEQKIVAGSIVGFLVAFGFGIFAEKQLAKRRTLGPDEILDRIKRDFKAEGPIEGSWIEMKRVPWKKFAHETAVYFGGITRREADELVQYEFIVDAYTGSLIDMYRL